MGKEPSNSMGKQEAKNYHLGSNPPCELLLVHIGQNLEGIGTVTDK